jgi:hypothetical protein
MRRRKIWWWLFAALVVGVVAGASPSMARGYQRLVHRRWSAQVAEAIASVREGHEVFRLPDSEHEEEEGEFGETDDPTMRRLATLARWGDRDQSFNLELLRTAASEARRWKMRLPAVGPLAAPPEAPVGPLANARSWVSLGPTNARFESSTGSSGENASTGRISAMRADPRDSNIVYVATAGGGVWKSYNAESDRPSWIPITDTLGSLSVGGLDIDPSHPETVWIGLGDPFDAGAGLALVSTDGGGTWSDPIELSGTHPADGRAVRARNVREVRVDPQNSKHVMIATDVGLFTTTDGASFQLADLPSATDPKRESAAWSIAYLGAKGGQTHWLVSGIYACGTNWAPPQAGNGVPAGKVDWCKGGTPGDMWKSVDSGKTWLSLRAKQVLPTYPEDDGDFGRLELAAATADDPSKTVVYVEAGSIDEGGGGTGTGTLSIMKTIDAGETWQTMAMYTTSVENPTKSLQTSEGTYPGDCRDMNLGHEQVWYNMAIAVDPANPNRVIVGGNFCAARTTDGGETWQNVAHWAPRYSLNSTAEGPLPYVHADWHTISIVRSGEKFLLWSGTDGGLATSANVFDDAPPDVIWRYPTDGMVTHLLYSVGSGDPADGNAGVLITGLQDNGTRIRDGERAGASTLFNEILGGDGIDAAVTNNGGTPAGEFVYWASIPGSERYLCRATKGECNLSAFSSKSGWTTVSLPLPAQGRRDYDPFFISYSPVNDAGSSILTGSGLNVWKIDSSKRVTRLSPEGFKTGEDVQTVSRVYASPNMYSINETTSRLYAAMLEAGRFAVGVDAGAGVTWTITPSSMGVGTERSQQIGRSSAIDFPSKAANFAENVAEGRVFVAASASPTMFDNSRVPDEIGHLFLTKDGGTTWQPLHGVGLPNVPINAVRFDPSDATDSTIYVGNDLGVYRSLDRGETWERFGIGLPMARVTDLFIAKNASLLRVSTYGRGLWEIYPNAMAGRGVAGNGDWDHNGGIDFFDLAALAARLDTTPAGQTAPYYDWNCDLNGDLNRIDEADLSALVAKFGSHP